MSASLNSILSVARTALQAEQLALQVAGHNLSNATTEGYSRQRADLVPGTPLVTPDGLLGTGVRVSGVTRARDGVLEPAVRREAASLSGASLGYAVLREVETVLGGAGDFGIGPALDAFWGAWADLANDPASVTGRVAVASAGQRLGDAFGAAAAAVDGVGERVMVGLAGEVAEANQLIRDIAELNARVVSASTVAGSAPDLEDRRDLLIDRLSELLPVAVTTSERGTVGVSVEGIALVDGAIGRTLSVEAAGGAAVLRTASGTEVRPSSGSIGAALDLVADDFAELREGLDQIARALVDQVNGAHAGGVGPTGTPGVLFFDDLGDSTTVTARTLSLSAAVLADPRAIAAGTADTDGTYRPGANDVALTLAAIRDTGDPGALDGRSVSAAHRDLLGGLGVTVSERREAQDRHELLLQAARERRDSVSAVSTDEELVQVIQIQAAYAAAARLIGVVDEMYQTLLSV